MGNNSVLDEGADYIVVLVNLPDGRSFVVSADKNSGRGTMLGSGTGLPPGKVQKWKDTTPKWVAA
jgi:hypothetical protein